MKRSLLTAAMLAGSLLSVSAVRAEDSFGIGSDAPPLNIEHWLSEGESAGPVTELKDGTVYVVEFWATWCGPCIQSMPHLAEIQEKYREQDVRIVSISDEDLETVKGFLEQKGPGDKTFAEITSAYSLTTDPDRSVYKDYFDAAGQSGIPTAFIVGKDGKVEWIGHPMTMDDKQEGEPLAKIVAGKWDREKFKKEYDEQNRMQLLMQKVGKFAQAGKMDEAVKLVEAEIATTQSPEMKEQLEMLFFNLKLSAGQVDDGVKTYFKDQIAKNKGNALEIGRASYMIYSAIQSGADVGDLADETIKALEGTVESAPEQYKPFLYNQLAQMQSASGNQEAAIAAQEKAVELTDGQAQKRMKLYLDELKGEGDDAEPAEPATDK